MTATESEAAAYEFTTLTCVPGTMQYKGNKSFTVSLTNKNNHVPIFVMSIVNSYIYPLPSFTIVIIIIIIQSISIYLYIYTGSRIQVLDLPGIIEGAAHGKGRGKEVIAVARSADAILIVLDAGKEGLNRHREILEKELETVGLRLNKTPPDVTFKKKTTGGVKFASTVPLTQVSVCFH